MKRSFAWFVEGEEAPRVGDGRVMTSESSGRLRRNKHRAASRFANEKRTLDEDDLERVRKKRVEEVPSPVGRWLELLGERASTRSIDPRDRDPSGRSALRFPPRMKILGEIRGQEGRSKLPSRNLREYRSSSPRATRAEACDRRSFPVECARPGSSMRPRVGAEGCASGATLESPIGE